MKSKIKMSFGIGAPSILLIFVSLTITVLSTLSLLTANSSFKLAKKSSDYVSSYYKADSIAEEWLFETYENLKNGIKLENNIFVVPISDTQSLELIIDIENDNLKIVSQKIIFTKEWDYSEFETQFNDVITNPN